MNRHQAIIFQRLEGAILFLADLAIYFWLGYSWWIFLLLLFAFDISMAGYLVNNRVGAFIYNLGHALVLPILLGAAAVICPLPMLFPIALLWFAHIGMDRALGYGLKFSTGFTHTHLGDIGRKD